MKYSEFIGLKLSRDTVEAARAQAEADDRTLSAYLRRIIVEGLRKPEPDGKRESESR